MLKKTALSLFVMFSLLLPTVSSAQSATTAQCPALTRALSLGSTGADVVALQQFLIAQGILPANDATGYYGPATQTAVKQYQAANGIVSSGTPATTGYGNIGPATRAFIASHCGSTAILQPQLGTCPTYQNPICQSNQHLTAGPVVNGCQMAPICVANTVVASLSGSVNQGEAPLTVSFSGNGGGQSYFGGVIINFGDGGTNTFCAPNVVCNQSSVNHVYQNAGSYIAKLVGTGQNGSSVLGAINITVTQPAVPFSANPTSGTVPLKVVFHGVGNIINFGDTSGQKTTDGTAIQETSHTYQTAGTYNASSSNATIAITVNATSTAATSTGNCIVPTHDLKVGDGDSSTGGDVTNLQNFLALDHAIYPEGLVTGFYGSATAAAVKRFQAAQNILQTGFVGPLTRSAIKAKCSGTSVTNSNTPYQFSASPTSAAAGTKINFTAINADTQASNFWYAVDFGDGTVTNMTPGSTTNTLVLSHPYASGGTYTAKLLQDEDTCGAFFGVFQYGCTKELMVDKVTITITGTTVITPPPPSGGTCATTVFSASSFAGPIVNEFMNYNPSALSPAIPANYMQGFGTQSTKTYPSGTNILGDPDWYNGTPDAGIPISVQCKQQQLGDACIPYTCSNGTWTSVYGTPPPRVQGTGYGGYNYNVQQPTGMDAGGTAGAGLGDGPGAAQ
jgi:peptidoglycan hydrolase-like protein with peptidoglycan-binding domain